MMGLLPKATGILTQELKQEPGSVGDKVEPGEQSENLVTEEWGWAVCGFLVNYLGQANCTVNTMEGR